MRPWLLLLLPLLSQAAIPGCADLEALESESEIAADALDNLLLCFCRDGETVSINCLYGSSIDHLKKASNAVKAVGKTVTQLSIQHIEFPKEGLEEGLFSTLTPGLESLEIRECATADPLDVTPAIKGLEATLRNLTVHGCNLAAIPAGVAALNQLENLVLTENKIMDIPAAAFAGKEKLRYLDLSSNFIAHAEGGAFSQLPALETLVIGDHNYLNDTLLDEIARLTSLQTLDISRADGVDEPPMSLWDHLGNLTTLKIAGCSLTQLEPGSFAPLKKLEQLDLRVNLIENITAFSFDGLDSLKRLALAGNYIRSVDKDTWTGLKQLEELDLGWNELKQLPADTFSVMGESLKTLNLRHNPMQEFVASTGLGNLTKLIISECSLKKLGSMSLADMESLEELDASSCNISSVHPSTFESQKESLRVLHLQHNQLSNLDSSIPSSLAKLEEIDISHNPFRCDDQLAKLITSVDEKYKWAAESSHDFLFKNSNDTTCARPWKLRGEAVLSLKADTLEQYDEAADTTTAAPSTPTTEEPEEETTPLVLPDIVVGAEDKNNSLLASVIRPTDKKVYDLIEASKTESESQSSSSAMPITLGILALVSVIAVALAAMFMKKKRNAAAISDSGAKKEAKAMYAGRAEDGMVEIQLDNK